MPVRPLKIERLSPTTIAMFDALAVVDEMVSDDVLAVGRTACMAEEPDVARTEGLRILKAGTTRTADQILLSGATSKAYNNLMIAVRSGRIEKDGLLRRMTADTKTQWFRQRPHLNAAASEKIAGTAAETATTPVSETVTPDAAVDNAQVLADAQVMADAYAALQARNTRPAPVLPPNLKHTSELHFGGIQEDEGWYYAPWSLHTLVHFRCNDEFDLDLFRTHLPTGMTVEYDPMTDLYRVYGRAGQNDGSTIEAFIDDFCAQQQIAVKGRRTEKKPTLRRDLSDLPPRFWDELCRHYGDYAMRVAQRHMSSIRMHVPDQDDVQQYVYLWVIRAATTFDHTRGVPFGAWIIEKVPAWAQDLARSRFGRTAYDVELNLKRTINTFASQYGRVPTEAELAELLNVDVEQVRRNSSTVAMLENIRSAQTIESSDPDAPEIPLADDHDVADDIMSETEQSLLSQALTASCAPEDGAKGRAAQPNVLGWAAWYFTTWGGKTKQALASDLNTSHRNINVYADKAKERMAERLADIVD